MSSRWVFEHGRRSGTAGDAGPWYRGAWLTRQSRDHFPYLAITTEQRGPQLVLRLQGELDVSNVDSLRQVLDGVLERAPQTLVVDLAGLSFADRAGLSFFVAARTRLAAQGHQLILLNAQPVVRRLLAVTGLDTVFRLSGSGPEDDPPTKAPA
jgi:anti-sigma B factor antagonist